MITRAAILLAALSLIAVACGDDDAVTTTTTATTGATTASTAAPATTGATAAPTPSDGPGGDIAELVARFEVAPARLTYLLGEGDDQTELIIAQDPTANPSIEAITIVENNSKIIISDGTTIFCDGSSNMCFEVPGGGGDSLAAGLLGPFASGVFLTAGPGGAIPGASVTEEAITIAGRSGVCFTYTAPDDFGADTDLVRQCIDNELGFTLLLQAGQTGTDVVETVMELIAFAAPTPADFEPTGPVTPSP